MRWPHESAIARRDEYLATTRRLSIWIAAGAAAASLGLAGALGFARGRLLGSRGAARRPGTGGRRIGPDRAAAGAVHDHHQRLRGDRHGQPSSRDGGTRMTRHGGSTAAQTAARGVSRAERLALSTRLTAGWHDSDRRASLLDRYGPLPQHGTGRHGTLIDAVTHAGLTGRGGAGFPTGVKMRSVASRRGQPVVVANGMESEPASEKDKALLARAPHLVLDGAVLAATAIGAGAVHLCLPRSREWLIAIARQAVAERERFGADQVAIEVHGMPHQYVSSEETSVVHWLNGGEARPTAVPPRPYEKGVAGRPTLLDNVETLAHVALIARIGPAWYRQAGLADAPGTMLTTISGAVDAPGVYEIEVGTPIGEVLDRSGTPLDAGPLLIGGYFGTWHDAQEVAGLPMAETGHCDRSARRRERACSSRCRATPAASPRPRGCWPGWQPREPASADLAYTGCPRSPTISPSWPAAAPRARCSTGSTGGCRP